MRTYLLWLPLRNYLVEDSGFLGVENTAFIEGWGGNMDYAPKFNTNPIVWYGTSIQQGLSVDIN